MLFDKPFISIPANKRGRDFATGDLNGCLEMLQALLDAVDFDPLRDRLFSTGLKIDGENKLLDCMLLALEPWFFAVLTGYEAVQEAALRSQPRQWRVAETDGLSGTVDPRPVPDLSSLMADVLAHLPLALEVSLHDGRRVGFTHCGIPSDHDWPEVRSIRTREAGLDDNTGTSLQSRLLWSDAGGKAAHLSSATGPIPWFVRPQSHLQGMALLTSGRTVKGIDLIVCGNACMPQGPVQLNNRLHMHTGAGDANGLLSLVELGTMKCWTATTPVPAISLDVIEIDIFCTSDSDLRHEFRKLTRINPASRLRP